MPVTLASPLVYTAEQTAQTIAALDRKASLFLGSVPPDGRVSAAQAVDLLNASRLPVYELMSRDAGGYHRQRGTNELVKYATALKLGTEHWAYAGGRTSVSIACKGDRVARFSPRLARDPRSTL